MQNIKAIQNKARFNQARVSLLLVVIFSLLNLFSLTFADVYFPFSSYVTQLIALFGAEAYLQTSDATILIIYFILAIISILPYLLSWIFSKKHIGWMIVSLVFFSIDSLIFLSDFIFSLGEGYYGLILNFVFRVYIFYSVIVGVIYAFKTKDDQTAQALADDTSATIEINTEEIDPEAATIARTVTLVREKAFTAMAISYVCLIDGNNVGVIKNNQTLQFAIDGRSHKLAVISPDRTAATEVEIAPGEESKSYKMRIKLGFNYPTITIEEI